MSTMRGFHAQKATSYNSIINVHLIETFKQFKHSSVKTPLFLLWSRDNAFPLI